MSHLLLLLTVAVVGFPPLESFLVAPSVSTGRLDPRARLEQQQLASRSSALAPAAKVCADRRHRPSSS